MVFELIKTYLICALLMYCYFIIGIQSNKFFRLKNKGLYHIVCGIFVYYTVFEILYLPFFIMKMSLTTLSIVWLVILGLDVIIATIVLRKAICAGINEIVGQLKCDNWEYVIISVAVFYIVMYCATRTFYYGYDTAFYIGMVNSAIHYDRMLVHQSEMGNVLRFLDFRYGLSGFYMHTAVLCKMFNISAILMQKQGMTIINVMISYIIMFLIGRKVFKRDTRYAYLLTAVYFAMFFFFLSDFSVAQFLLYRAYEAKSYCCNIVIPALFLEMYSAFRMKDISGYRWRRIAILATGSIPISMSSILIIPVIVMVFACSMAVVYKKLRYVLYGVGCSMANGIFLIVYYLNVIGKLSVRI